MNTIVRDYLIELARKKANQIVSYQKLSDDCHLKLSMQDNPTDRTVLGNILGQISEFEFRNRRPLLCALVKRAGSDYEGDGFYKLADDLGFGHWQTLKRDGIFEAQQIGACISFWKDNANYIQFR